MPKCNEIEYNGVKYPSLSKLCHEYNLDYNRVEGRLYRGWSLEDAINTPRIEQDKIELSYDNKIYSSLNSLCEENGLTYSSVYYGLKSGLSLEDAISKSKVEDCKAISFEYNGKKYRNLSCFCKEHDLNYGTIQARIKRGWSIEDAINKPIYSGKQFTYNGKEYSSINSFCKEHGLSCNLIRNRLRKGCSLEDALNKPKSNRHTSITYRGRLYKSIAELSRDTGVSYDVLKNRLRSGYSIEECIVLQDINLKKQSDSFYKCKCTHCGLKFLGTLDIAKKHAREHKEDYENMILNYKD